MFLEGYYNGNKVLNNIYNAEIIPLGASVDLMCNTIKELSNNNIFKLKGFKHILRLKQTQLGGCLISEWTREKGKKFTKINKQLTNYLAITCPNAAFAKGWDYEEFDLLEDAILKCNEFLK